MMMRNPRWQEFEASGHMASPIRTHAATTATQRPCSACSSSGSQPGNAPPIVGESRIQSNC